MQYTSTIDSGRKGQYWRNIEGHGWKGVFEGKKPA
jgi:hypothetical protein